jgi:hypothetical protein
VSQPTERTLASVGPQDTFSKRTLVTPYPHLSYSISALLIVPVYP